MSFRAYARHRRVDPKTVRKAADNGRLERSVGRRHGRRVIVDVALADHEWVANRDPAKVRGRGTARAAAIGTDLPGPMAPDTTMAAARRRITDAQARRIEQEVALRAGELIERSEARRQNYESAKTVRDGVMNIPDRIANALAAETDVARVHALLSEELRRALEVLAEMLEP